MNDVAPRTAPPAVVEGGLQTMWAFRLLHDDVTGETIVEMYDCCVPEETGQLLATINLGVGESPSEWAKRQIVMALDEIDY